jgi:DMSO reductase family type II enzyme heme b subunit
MTPSEAIDALKLPSAGAELRDPDAPAWKRLKAVRLALEPAPVPMAAGVSPYLAQSTGHGRVRELRVRLAHDGESLAVRLSWTDPSRDEQLGDLDQFVDAAAVMFPLAESADADARADAELTAAARTMGSEQAPVNLWLWKADQREPFDVIARGYSTSRKRPASESGLEAQARWADGGWSLVFRRPLAARADERVELRAGAATRIAFAVWEGSNAERAGQKSASAGFTPLVLAP